MAGPGVQAGPLRDMAMAAPALQVAPAIPGNGVALTNTFGKDCMVYLIGGTSTVIQVTPPGGAATQVGTTQPAAIFVPSGWSITVTFTVISTSWVWQAIN